MKKIIRYLIVFLLLFSFGNNLCHAEEFTTPSGIKYSELEEKINNYIEERKDGTASVSVSIFNNQETLYQVQYGYSDIENKVKVDENTVYEWGSVSKLLVWVSVMQLYEQGKIDLNEDIKTYLPDNFLTKLKYDKSITMVDLMNHQGGWQEVTYDVEVIDINKIVDLKTALKETEPAQVFEPGTVTAYSNWSTSLAAYIVECITGQDYANYIKENIFEVLGMKQTAVKPDWSDNEWVQSQRKKVKTYSIYSDSFESYGTNLSYINLYPAGATTGTLDDFVLFAKALVPNALKQSPLFEKVDTLNTMLSATSYYGDSDLTKNAHGFWAMYYNNIVLGHSGNTNGFTSTLMFDPETGLGIVIMTNEVGETTYNYGLLSYIYGDYNFNEKITDYKDISGIYLYKRSIFKGFTSMFKYTLFVPVFKTEESGVYKLMGEDKIYQVSDNRYMFDNGNGLKYLLYHNEINGSLEMFSTDLYKVGSVELIIAVILIFSFFLNVIYGLIKLVCYIIQFIKKKNIHMLSISRLITISSCLIGSVLTIYMLFVNESFTHTKIMISSILLVIISFIPIINLLLYIFKHKDIVKNEKQRKYIIPMIITLLLTIAIYYFQLYNFWSC